MTLKKSKQMAKIRQYINDALNIFFKNLVQARIQKIFKWVSVEL